MPLSFKELYAGSRELFEGLWIKDQWDWEQTNPVIWIKFSSQGVKTMGMEAALHKLLGEAAQNLGIGLQESHYDQKFKVEASQHQLIAFDFENLDPTTVLFQTGYLTIQKYVPEDLLYTLDYPNMEVKHSLQQVLLNEYLNYPRQSAEEALVQIKEKGYLAPYADSPKEKIAVGVNFSSEARKVVDWKVEAKGNGREPNFSSYR